MTSRTEILYESDRFVVGDFRCDVSDPRWDRENAIEDGFNVIFPSTPVRITHRGAGGVVSDRNQIMLYDDGQRFRREAASPEGDVCTFVVVDEAFLRAAALEAGVRTPSRGFSFPLRAVPARSATYLLSRLVAERLRAGAIDRREVDAHLTQLVTEVIGEVAAFGAAARTGGSRPAHVTLAENVKLMLADFAPSTRLIDLARALSVSQFHLARIFRKHTGFTLHAYRDQLRLRFCLDRLLRGDASVSELSYAAGYSSPSHLSENFRRSFGFPPSRVRDVIHGRKC